MLHVLSQYSGNQAIIALLAFFIAILVALTVHEFAHAYTAYKQGDSTAKAYGRLTLNPKSHIDPIGILMLLFVGFGWAKPVPVNPARFKNYRLGTFLVSIAGVVVNFITFILFTALIVLISNGAISLDLTSSIGFFLYVLVNYIATISLFLAIFNLLPIAPLDGFNIVSSFTRSNNDFLRFMRKNGQIILIVLLITGALQGLVTYLYSAISNPITTFFTNLFF